MSWWRRALHLTKHGQLYRKGQAMRFIRTQQRIEAEHAALDECHRRGAGAPIEQHRDAVIQAGKHLKMLRRLAQENIRTGKSLAAKMSKGTALIVDGYAVVYVHHPRRHFRFVEAYRIVP